MAISERAMTLEEFLALPEAEPALEFWDGLARQKVSPQGQHGILQFRFAEQLNHVVEPRQLGQVFTETRFTCGGRAPVPDISFYVPDRVPLLPSGEVSNDILEPPDLAVEIASPGQSLVELFRKCLWYAEHGVRITLLVAPDDRAVIAFRPGVPPLVLQGADRIDLDEILPGFELTVAGLFELLTPPWGRPAKTPAE